VEKESVGWGWEGSRDPPFTFPIIYVTLGPNIRGGMYVCIVDERELNRPGGNGLSYMALLSGDEEEPIFALR
jgi:hypothetical protein